MFIESISCQSFKQYKEPTEIKLEDFCGRIGILGDNGSGKSSLLSVISIALYGVKAIDGNKNLIRTQGLEKEPVILRCDFCSNDKVTGKPRHFSIVREFRGINMTAKAEISERIGDDYIPLADTVNGVNTFVEKLLNMDYEIFVNTVYCKQKELSNLAEKDPAERRRLVLEITGVYRIEDEIKKTRKLKEESKRTSELLINDVSEKENVLKKIKDVDDEIKELKKKNEKDILEVEKKNTEFQDISVKKSEQDIKYEKYNTLVIEHNNSSNKIEHLNKDIERVEALKEEATKACEYMTTKGNDILKSYEEIKKRLALMEESKVLYIKKGQLLEQINKVKEVGGSYNNNLKVLSEKIKELDFDKDSIEKIKEQIAALEKNIDKIKVDAINKQNDTKNIDVKLKEITGEINKISKMEGCTCFTCKQNISSEHVSILKSHYEKEEKENNNKKIALLEEIKVLKNDLQVTTNELKDVKTQETSLRAKEKEYTELITKYKTFKNQYNEKLNEYKTLMAEYTKIGEVEFDEQTYMNTKNTKDGYDKSIQKVYVVASKAENIDKVQNELLTILKNKETETSNLANIKAKARELNFNKEEYNNVKNSYTTIFNELNELKENAKNIIIALEKKEKGEKKFLQDKLKSIKEKEKQYNESLQASSLCIKLEDTLVKAKERVMSKIRPLINNHFSQIFRTLLDGKYDDIELTETYDIFIYDNGTPFPLSRFSGGEQDVANLALRLAISKFLTELHQGSIEFIILDEIFASLDDSRKSALIEVLGGLSSLFKQIFIISHEDVIKSSLDSYIMIKENEFGYSEVEL